MSWSRLIGCISSPGTLPRTGAHSQSLMFSRPSCLYGAKSTLDRLGAPERTMAAVGEAASVIAIYVQLEACIKGLRRLYKSFKFAKQEVRQMMEEVQVCQGLSQIFNEISRPLGSRVITLAREKKLDELLQSQATSAQEQTDRMTTKLKPLMNRGRGSPSRFEELWAQVWWHYTKHEGQALLVTLGTVKHSLTLLSSLLLLDNSLTMISQLSTASQGYALLWSQM